MVQCGVRNTREKAGYTHDRNKTQTQFEAAFFGGGRQCKDLYDESHAALVLLMCMPCAKRARHALNLEAVTGANHLLNLPRCCTKTKTGGFRVFSQV